MNAKIKTFIISTTLLAAALHAENIVDTVNNGNAAYKEGHYQKALDLYQQAADLDDENPEIKYNQANSLYNLEKLDEAIKQYREVSAQSKDAQLVNRAKFNLANAYQQKAQAQQQTDPQAATKDLTTSLDYYRQVLDAEKETPDAAHNLAVCKHLLRQIKEQQQQQDKQNQDQQDQQENQDEQQKQDQKQQDQQEQNQDQQQDKQDQNQQQDKQQQEKQQNQDQQQQQEMNEDEQQVPPPPGFR